MLSTYYCPETCLQTDSRKQLRFLSVHTETDISLNCGNVIVDTSVCGLLLYCTALVCAHYGVRVDNFSASFSDGRALCYLISHYQRGYLSAYDDIRDETTLSKSSESHLTQQTGMSDTITNSLTNITPQIRLLSP